MPPFFFSDCLQLQFMFKLPHVFSQR